MYTLQLEAAGSAARLAPAPVAGSGCRWSSANASVQGHTIRARATGSKHFTLDNVGTLSADGCEINWSTQWAPWRKQAQREV